MQETQNQKLEVHSVASRISRLCTTVSLLGVKLNKFTVCCIVVPGMNMVCWGNKLFEHQKR